MIVGGASDPICLFLMLLCGGGRVVVVGGGGRAGGRRTVKATNYKRWGWDRSSDVRMLFEGDPARPRSPSPCGNVSNKQGECVLKIRCPYLPHLDFLP